MQYNKNQKLGWSHLTDPEKSVLTLIVVNERSKQEAATILNLSFYKFNELFSRARRLFIMFSQYYEEQETLVPKGLAIDPKFQAFIPFLLLDRKKPITICSKVPGLEDLIPAKARNNFWYELFNSMDPESQSHQKFKELILEYDRWNAFRILPKKLRKPSPYLRRRNSDYKKIIKILSSFSEIQWSIMTRKFTQSSPPFAYIPKVMLSCGYFEAQKIGYKNTMLAYMTSNKIPVFLEEKEAKEFAELVYDYKSITNVSPYMSHKFWAKFRTLFPKVLNFKELMNIDPGEFLEFSLKDKEFVSKLKVRKSKKISIKPLRDSVFWG